MQTPTDNPVSVTAEHVRRAWYSMHDSFGRAVYSPWAKFLLTLTQTLATGLAGAGSQALEQPWGIFCFGFGLFVAALLACLHLSNAQA